MKIFFLNFKKLKKIDNSFKNYNRIYKKMNFKGFAALEILLGVVFSTIALVFVVQFIFNLFLNVPVNQDIARNNAKSIVEFVDFSNENFNYYYDCYTMLKLTNLENFQFDTKDFKKNYFLVIGKYKDEFGVYVVPLNYYAEVEKLLVLGKSISKFKKSFLPFSKDVKLKFDVTNDDKFNFVLYFKLNKLDKSLEFSPNYVGNIILVPKFNKKILEYEVKFVDSDDNVLIGKSLINKEFEVSNGFFLGYNPSKRILFLTKSKYSNMFLRYKNCLRRKFEDFDKIEYIKSSPDKADFFNYELVFDYVNEEGVEQNKKFIWRGGQIVCPTQFGKSCLDYFGKNYKRLSYNEFLVKLKKEVILDKDFGGTDEMSYEFKLVEMNKLLIKDIVAVREEMKKNGEELHYDYEKLFVVKEIDGIVAGKIGEFDEEDVLKAGFGANNIYYDLMSYRKDRKKCVSKYCDYIGFLGNNPYYYDSVLKKFVLFNIGLLRMDEQENVYFEGKKLKKVKESFDDVPWSLFKYNYDFYLFDIDTVKGERTIVLSQFQLNNILEKENYKK